MIAYHILLCFILNVTVIYRCIHFLLAPLEGLSYKPKYTLLFTNIFYFLFYILILFLTLLLVVTDQLAAYQLVSKEFYTRSGTVHWFDVVALPYYISLLCLPWSLEERPWLGGRGGRVFCLLL